MKKIMRSGFTLVELIIVIAIIGVLASIVVVRYAGKTDQAKVAAAKAHIQGLETAILDFQAQNSRLPRTLEELVVKPADCPNWDPNGYLKSSKVPKDPWGHDYLYKLENGNYEIICYGADGQEGGEGVNKDLNSKTIGN